MYVMKKCNIACHENSLIPEVGVLISSPLQTMQHANCDVHDMYAYLSEYHLKITQL